MARKTEDDRWEAHRRGPEWFAKIDQSLAERLKKAMAAFRESKQ